MNQNSYLSNDYSTPTEKATVPRFRFGLNRSAEQGFFGETPSSVSPHNRFQVADCGWSGLLI